MTPLKQKGLQKMKYTKLFDVKQAISGVDQTYWIKLGIAVEKADTLSVKLDALPLPNEKGQVWLQLYPQKEKEDEIQKKHVETLI